MLKLAVVLVLGLVCAAHAKTFGRCELARKLIELGLTSRNQVSDWVCLVEHESSYRTHVKGGPNWNGSYDWGLFQINDYYWCHVSTNAAHNDCGINCSNLLDNNIADDVACAKIIYNRHGFNAWYGWINNCQGDTSSYISGCGL